MLLAADGRCAGFRGDKSAKLTPARDCVPGQLLDWEAIDISCLPVRARAPRERLHRPDRQTCHALALRISRQGTLAGAAHQLVLCDATSVLCMTTGLLP